jgi:hypothetical protein
VTSLYLRSLSRWLAEQLLDKIFESEERKAEGLSPSKMNIAILEHQSDLKLEDLLTLVFDGKHGPKHLFFALRTIMAKHRQGRYVSRNVRGRFDLLPAAILTCMDRVIGARRLYRET